MMAKREITIKQVNNGYIVTLDSAYGLTTEVFEEFNRAIEVIKNFFGERT